MLDSLAHVKWFAGDDLGTEIAGLNSSEWLVVVVSIAIGILLMYLVNKLMNPLDLSLDKRMKSLSDWVPTIVRYSTALLIIFNFWKGYLLAPNFDFNDGAVSLLINAVLIAVALLLVFGAYTRTAGAALLILFGLSALILRDPLQLFEHLEYVGLGLFLMLSSSGKFSVQPRLSDPLESLASRSWLATPLLKTFAGLSLVVLAFSEKLANMTLSNEFLLQYNWNFLSSFGVSDRNFIIAAGIIEVLLGLTLILNLASRLGTLALLCVMLATAILLGPEEIFGHMFAVAVVAAVWVGPNESLFKKRFS